MPGTIEIGRFSVKAGEEEEFLAKRQAMLVAAKQHFAGLIDVRLAKLEDGTYVDVAFWESREACHRAIEKAEGIAPVAEWLGHVDADLSMDFGTLVDEVAFADV